MHNLKTGEQTAKSRRSKGGNFREAVRSNIKSIRDLDTGKQTYTQYELRGKQERKKNKLWLFLLKCNRKRLLKLNLPIIFFPSIYTFA